MSKGQEEADCATAERSGEEADDAAEEDETADDLSPAEARCLISLGESDES